MWIQPRPLELCSEVRGNRRLENKILLFWRLSIAETEVNTVNAVSFVFLLHLLTLYSRSHWMSTMAEYDIFHKQTMSIMTLLIETVLDEIQNVFECRPSHTEISSDRDPILDMNEKQRRLVRLLSFCRYIVCYLIINKLWLIRQPISDRLSLCLII